MRIERRLTLTLMQERGQGNPAAAGRLLRGLIAHGDGPDWESSASVRLVAGTAGDALLARARPHLAEPREGLAAIVDLGRVGDECFVAYKWMEGASLVGLVKAGLSRERAHRIVDAIAEVLHRTGVTHATDALEQIFVTETEGRTRVQLTDWAPSTEETKLDASARITALRELLAPATPVAPGRGAAPPRSAFDAALGAALADEAPALTHTNPSPRTRALPHLAWPVVKPDSGPQPSAPAAEPKKPSRWPLAAVAALGLAAATFLLTQSHPSPSPSPSPSPPPSPSPSPSPSPPPSPSPSPSPSPPPPPSPPPSPSPSPPPSPSPSPSPVRHPSSLSIRSDVAAVVFLDGRALGEAPIVDRVVPPGRHRVRLESLDGALRLLPREESVTLAPGQHETLTIDLK